MEGGAFHHHLKGARCHEDPHGAWVSLLFDPRHLPGLFPDPSVDAAIEGEVYDVPDETLRDEPSSQRAARSWHSASSSSPRLLFLFDDLCAAANTNRAPTREITTFGGWRRYLRAWGCLCGAGGQKGDRRRRSARRCVGTLGCAWCRSWKARLSMAGERRKQERRAASCAISSE